MNSHFVEQNKNEKSKLLIMFGYDANIASVMSVLDFAPYQLPEQYENTPIGGKLVFQRWHDKKTNKDYLKVEYIYQSVNQLRAGTPLTLNSHQNRSLYRLRITQLMQVAYVIGTILKRAYNKH